VSLADTEIILLDARLWLKYNCSGWAADERCCQIGDAVTPAVIRPWVGAWELEGKDAGYSQGYCLWGQQPLVAG